jgi:hypothetical protein
MTSAPSATCLDVQVIEARHIAESDEAAMSLALSLGKKRTVTAECDDILRALDETLARHDFTATR